MNPTHYIDVALGAPEIERELHARLLTAVHHRILAGDALAVAWPGWRQEQGNFGLLFRIFGEAQSLDRCLAGMAPLIERELIRPGPISAVPDVPLRVVFTRDRSVDRYSPSATRRMTQRANLRGTKFHPKRAAQGGAHALALKSSSTDNIFHLFVRRMDSVSANGGGCRYGLGHALPDF
jgi:CRISPR-associated protein (Cas_Csy4)